MIQLSPLLSSLLQNIEIEAFYLVAIGSYRTTSYFRQLTLSTGETYLADGNLVGVDPPALSSVVSKELFSVQVADPVLVAGTFAEEGLNGKVMTVRIGFADAGTPILTTAETILLYSGRVASGTSQTDTSAVGEALFMIQGSSPMSDLDHTRAYWTNREFMRGLSPDDNSFDSSHEGSGTLILGWGKR